MKEVLADIDRWLAQGQRVALARVVGVEGSGPRDPGATMAVSDQGEVAGSVSGGCVEGAVVSEATRAFAERLSPRVVSFGYSDAEALTVGLTCGGTVHVLVDPGLPTFYPRLREALLAEAPVAQATVVRLDREGEPGQLAEGAAIPISAGTTWVGASILVEPSGAISGSLGNPDLDRVVARDALGAIAAGQSDSRHYGLFGEAQREAVTVFVEAFAPPPRMLIFGAVDFTAALAQVAKVLGYRVTVCDARSTFATRARFPMADEVVCSWPHVYLDSVSPPLQERDAICVLTHDPKFDVPALRSALATRAGYLGALGSRRTHEERCRTLVAEGVPASELERIMGPIGMDIGARTPEETAISICAEIIAVRTGRPAPSLRDGKGPIHKGAVPTAPAAATKLG
ncbi:MAG: XdhC family protein [Candidatus Dormibacteria bacterium]